MKKYLLLLSIVALALTGCESFYGPEASFEATKSKVKPYEEIQFYNYSKYADSYEWSFGDGVVSTVSEPVHYYTSPGTYEVKLSAYKGDQVSYSYLTITVISADLNILVLDIDNNHVVPDAKVTLYSTYTDWVNGSNKKAIGYTDADGIVEFFELPEGFYYMDIYNNHYDNFGLGNSDVRYITTPFIFGGTTYINAFAEYVSSNVSGKVKKSMVIKKYKPYTPEMSIRKDIPVK